MKIVKVLVIAAVAAMVLAAGGEANAKSTIANSPCKEDRQRLSARSFQTAAPARA
jgi:hypothetical protein